MGGMRALAKRVGYIEFIWAEGWIRLYAYNAPFVIGVLEHLLPQAHYHVPDGWLKQRWATNKIKIRG